MLFSVIGEFIPKYLQQYENNFKQNASRGMSEKHEPCMRPLPQERTP